MSRNSVSRPTLLLISPTFPRNRGSGLAMRAAAWLSALQQHFNVYLLVLPVSDYRNEKIDPDLKKLCTAISVVDHGFKQRIKNVKLRLLQKTGLVKLAQTTENAWLTLEIIDRAGRQFPGISFDLIHVLRSYLSPVAEYVRSRQTPTPRFTIDLDDIESMTRKRLAELYELKGRSKQAANLRSQANWYIAFENMHLKKYDRIFVCSENDSRQLAERGFENVSVIPNCVSEKIPAVHPDPNSIFSFIFVGNFNYLPNQDAVDWFCDEILPRLKNKTNKAFKVYLIGSGSLQRRQYLQTRHKELVIVENAAELDSYYGCAHVAIVPIRAGGGTRIKIIEAFSYGKAVVSTTIGSEGLDVKDALHIFLADTVEAFCDACLLLMDNAPIRQAASKNAKILFEESYSFDRFKNLVCTHFKIPLVTVFQ